MPLACLVLVPELEKSHLNLEGSMVSFCDALFSSMRELSMQTSVVVCAYSEQTAAQTAPDLDRITLIHVGTERQ